MQSSGLESSENYRVVGKIGLDDNYILGCGARSHVCMGYFEDVEWSAAIRVMDNSSDTAYEIWKKEVRILRKMTNTDKNQNIIAYRGSEELGKQLFIAMELADTTLQQLITQIFPVTSHNFPPPSMNEIRMYCHQICKGISALHSYGIVHSNIKPSNVLIFLTGITSGRNCTIAKVSDLGLRKTLSDSAINIKSSTKGTQSYMSPECIRALYKGEQFISTKASDIFSLGLTLFYAVTRGAHPYGLPIYQAGNLYKAELNFDALSGPVALLDFYNLITPMLTVDMPQERPTCKAILTHPCFWSTNKRQRFIIQTADFVSTRKGKKCEKSIMKNGCQLIGKGWKNHILDVVKILRKERAQYMTAENYSTTSIVDLIKFIRNQYAHFFEKCKEFQNFFGNDREVLYMTYFETKFPFLLPFLYIHLQNFKSDFQQFYANPEEVMYFPALPKTHSSYID